MNTERPIIMYLLKPVVASYSCLPELRNVPTPLLLKRGCIKILGQYLNNQTKDDPILIERLADPLIIIKVFYSPTIAWNVMYYQCDGSLH